MSKFQTYQLIAAGLAIFQVVIVYSMAKAVRAKTAYVFPTWQGLIYRGRELPLSAVKWRIAATVISFIGIVLFLTNLIPTRYWYGIVMGGLGLTLAVDFLNWRKVGSGEPPPIPPARTV